MPSARSATIVTQLAVGGWFALLIVLIALESSGVLSPQATSAFTIVLVVVGIAGPFALVATFLYRRSKLDRRVAVEGKCPRCRYDLTGQPDWADSASNRPVQCPECGEMVLRSSPVRS